VNELEAPSQYRFDTIILSVMGSALLLYIVMGMCGYATYGDQVPHSSSCVRPLPVPVPVPVCGKPCSWFGVSHCSSFNRAMSTPCSWSS
jgi:hypothetical protein